MAIQRFQAMKRLRPDLAGTLRVNFDGSAEIRSAEALVTSLKGDAAANGLSLDNRSIGNAKVAADTQASVLHVKLVKDVSQVILDGVLGHHQTCRELAVRCDALDE